MIAFEQTMNSVFARRLVLFALAIGALKCLIRLSSFDSPSWTMSSELFLVGALVLYKKSVPPAWLRGNGGSRMKAFLKSVAVYFLPATVGWTLFNAELFLGYLPQLGLRLTPIWSTLVTSLGVFALAKGLLNSELLLLRRST